MADSGLIMFSILMVSYFGWHSKWEPPYAESHVREDSKYESRKKTTSFSSYSVNCKSQRLLFCFYSVTVISPQMFLTMFDLTRLTSLC